MKRIFFASVILVITGLIWLQPLNVGRTEVTIPDGATAREIADYLAQHHVIRDKQEFIFWLRISWREKDLKSGTYVLYKYKNPLYLINKLTAGGRSDIAVTIPEGLTVYEIADILDNHGIVERDSFLSICMDKKTIEQYQVSGPSLEGYLFPDTYSFSHSQSDSQVVFQLIKNFGRRMKKYGISDADSVLKILILASLVEKEARVDEERPVIARVFLNRLETNRPLESCATVLFALKSSDYEKYRSKTVLTKSNLKFKSPYNTYLNTGLPPGPICSPGESSIKAVIDPADVDYLYFVSKGDGHHHFSKTYQEHLAAKEKYNAKE
jgi:UPF0755 protein